MFIAVLAVASSVGPAFAAGLKALSPVDAMQKFARCDASFFALLAADPTPFGSAIELTRKGPHATPKVRNPWAGVRQDGVQEFAQPIEVEGLRLLAWREDAATVPPLGTFIRWGFEVEGKPERVAVRLNRLLPLHLKLSSRDGAWTRARPATTVIQPTSGSCRQCRWACFRSDPTRSTASWRPSAARSPAAPGFTAPCKETSRWIC
ncbi:hypothetical protein [Variovorax sp. J22R115]|uniref:hypothetical protein n=1 Tax=Variovorax sp. J22R115 TaxID=3053509 RepID=UPI0025787B79|nr:hypothetical protein [Variovorax sp. J22R115]MDM0049804.1 hypothetical protein [Variovorax sp. J22R115]